MDLKEKLISSYFAFEEQVDTDSEIHDIRSEAIKNFETVNTSFPNFIKLIRSLGGKIETK